MRRLVLFFLLMACCCAAAYSLEIDSLFDKKFGTVTIYRPVGTPNSVAMFVSGDGGWKHGVLNMAKNIANQGALVLGIDAKYYGRYMRKISSACLYPAADFEELSLDIQKRCKMAVYHKPVLIGYSYGAVLVYGILAQAPANTFKGAIALGFCPDIDLPKPLCKGKGLTQHVLKPGKTFVLEPSKTLTEPFIVLNGVKDQTCPFEASATYLKGMPMTELVTLPKVGHGFSIDNNWLPQFNAAYKKILASKIHQSTTTSDEMPVTLVPSSKKNKLPLVFFISGDGGWTGFDHSLAEAMAAKGYSVIGLDAQRYFWKAKTPESSAAAIGKLISHFQEEWNKPDIILAGYSFGASMIPFIAQRLTDAMKTQVKTVVLLSPDETADFEIHIMDMLHIGSKRSQYDVIAETKKIKALNPVCIFGQKEDEGEKMRFAKNGIQVVNIPGGHHFTDDYGSIVEAMMQRLK